MKIAFAIATGLVLAAAQVPALADEGQAAAATGVTAADVKPDAWVWSADSQRIGRISVVRADQVLVIYTGKFVAIPMATLSKTEKGFATTLTRKEVNRL